MHCIIQADPQSDAMYSEETETRFHTVLLHWMTASLSVCFHLPTYLLTTYHTI